MFDAIKPGLANSELLKPYAEIGRELGMTEGHVKIEMHRVRKRLAEELRMGPPRSIPAVMWKASCVTC